ncbi:hypothetical protein LTR56_002826 [Elasticomyces elasticus]|uniref:Uncharacterized protein n=1 Tax=Elasticomyces elasticus TaxID=574655 RepID=A0AAN7VQ56_9PEZI|nr:hypothetical protein LTR56_002826 [Elasticomyces elasticus]KAK3666717.1 hypothetical protein LTR22_002304 [Elasticomyces elasticus]KAK4920441.1 hypothetical protein LTR49_012033 [Elasticomyces elasticus]KAK5698002.1 hypothetical protein LTR97_006962 [Elasticomyces elasticus]KAK5759272.1 hypothetical protein LTS12_010595 [Elasticomyces elasticus]
MALYMWVLSVAWLARNVEDQTRDLTATTSLYEILRGHNIRHGISLLAVYGRRDSSTDFNDVVGQLAAGLKFKDGREEDEDIAELRIVFVRAVVSQVEKDYRIWQRLWPEAGRKDELGKLD